MFHFQSSPHCAAFWLMHTWQRLHLVHRRASHVRLYLLYEVNKCARVNRRSLDRKKELEKRQRPTAAKAGSPDIIEDDISDYPKDRNLSLSVLYFQLFYHSQSLWLSIHLENVLNCLLIGLERQLFNGDPCRRGNMTWTSALCWLCTHMQIMAPIRLWSPKGKRFEYWKQKEMISVPHFANQVARGQKHQCSWDNAVGHVSQWRCAL